MALLPVPGSPFRAKFSGPQSIVRQVTERDYVIATPDRRKPSQLCHIHLLKPYYSSSSELTEDGDDSVECAALAMGGVTCAPSQQVADGEEDYAGPDDCVLLPRLKNSEMLKTLDDILGHMAISQRG